MKSKLPTQQSSSILLLVALLTFSVLLTVRSLFPLFMSTYDDRANTQKVEANTNMAEMVMVKFPKGISSLSALLEINTTSTKTSNAEKKPVEANETTSKAINAEPKSALPFAKVEGLPGRFTHALKWRSPSNGTDVISHPTAVVRCVNQTSCIQPQLQLTRVFNIYYCKHVSYGVRFYFLVREGLLLHPNVNLVADPAIADLIVWLPGSAEWHKSECKDPKFRERLVVLDENDGPEIFDPDLKAWRLAYFKRSYVRRHDGAFKKFMGYVQLEGKEIVFPMTYTIAEAYVRPNFKLFRSREIDLLCTLRGSKFDPTRLRIRQWVSEYVQARGIARFHAGELNGESRTVISKLYFGKMHDAKIIVTVNPSDWEGDFRFMEAMASGALVLVDNMYVPRMKPLTHGVHVVYYDNNNKTNLFDLLDMYKNNVDLARQVAVRGYLHSMKHHRAVNLVDYVLRTTHQILNSESSSQSESAHTKYRETGFDLREQAIRFKA